MTNELVGTAMFRSLLLSDTPIVDVRAPVEFAEGSIPGSVNLPLLTDDERHQVGIAYKTLGQEAAVTLGHKLVSGQIREARLADWKNYLEDNPTALVTCFRGGLRSKISQSWIKEMGIQRPRIEGGFKALRGFLLSELVRLSQRPFLVIAGMTGSGKTLTVLRSKGLRPTVDLEDLAKHRGSAFGAVDEPQPSQVDFENRLTVSLLKEEARESSVPLVVEDESRLIGRCSLPDVFFENLRRSDVVLIEEPVLVRTQVIFDDYIAKLSMENRLNTFERYQASLNAISKKLGGTRHLEVSQDLKLAIEKTRSSNDLECHKIWIEKLLVWYYDPLYLQSLKKRNPRIVFQGTRAEVDQYLSVRSTTPKSSI
jgi:tRNA 2-selenouridine synthase